MIKIQKTMVLVASIVFFCEYPNVLKNAVVNRGHILTNIFKILSQKRKMWKTGKNINLLEKYEKPQIGKRERFYFQYYLSHTITRNKFN